MTLRSAKPTSQFVAALLVLVVCGAAFLLMAQKLPRTNFSGTWVMEDVGRSQDLSGRDLIIERPSSNLSHMTLKIADDGNDIKVLRMFTIGGETREQNLEYHANGRGEANPTMGSPTRTFSTRTRWTRDHLLIRFDPFTASVAGRPVTGYREIEWRLTDDGTKLIETDTTRYQESSTIDSTVSASELRQPSIVPPAMTVRRVYKKQS
jgi:hypothetical protein